MNAQHYIAPNGEIIEPVYRDVDVYDPEAPDVVLLREGEEIPLAERYTPEFVATLREYDPDAEPNPPEREPVPQPAPTADQVRAQRDGALSFAALRIAPLQDAVDLDDATADDVAALKAWKQYRVAVSRIEQQPGFPGSVNWPEQPQ